MVELLRAHGLDQAQVVHVFFQMGQSVGNPLPTLSRLMKWILRSQQLRHTIDKSEALTGQERSRAILSIKPRQFRFMFEEFQLTGRSRHVQVDDPPRLGGKLWRQDRKRGRRIAGEIKIWTCGD